MNGESEPGGRGALTRVLVELGRAIEPAAGAHALPSHGTRARGIAWLAFWLMLFWFGSIQAWHFSDTPPKPFLLDSLGMLGFWLPAVVMFAPVWWIVIPLSSSPPLAMTALWIAAAVWSASIAYSMVWVENRVLPRGWRFVTWLLLAGTVAALLLLRGVPVESAGSAPGSAPTSFSVLMTSSLLLLALVAAAYASLLIAMISVGIRLLRSNTPDAMAQHRG